MRCDEISASRAEIASADPHLLCAPLAGDLRFTVVHQRGMHGQNGIAADLVRQVDGCVHRLGVSDDH